MTFKSILSGYLGEIILKGKFLSFVKFSMVLE